MSTYYDAFTSAGAGHDGLMSFRTLPVSTAHKRLTQSNISLSPSAAASSTNFAAPSTATPGAASILPMITPLSSSLSLAGKPSVPSLLRPVARPTSSGASLSVQALQHGIAQGLSRSAHNQLSAVQSPRPSQTSSVGSNGNSQYVSVDPNLLVLADEILQSGPDIHPGADAGLVSNLPTPSASLLAHHEDGCDNVAVKAQMGNDSQDRCALEQATVSDHIFLSQRSQSFDEDNILVLVTSSADALSPSSDDAQEETDLGPVLHWLEVDNAPTAPAAPTTKTKKDDRSLFGEYSAEDNGFIRIMERFSPSEPSSPQQQPAVTLMSVPEDTPILVQEPPKVADSPSQVQMQPQVAISSPQYQQTQSQATVSRSQQQQKQPQAAVLIPAQKKVQPEAAVLTTQVQQKQQKQQVQQTRHTQQIQQHQAHAHAQMLDQMSAEAQSQAYAGLRPQLYIQLQAQVQAHAQVQAQGYSQTALEDSLQKAQQQFLAQARQAKAQAHAQTQGAAFSPKEQVPLTVEALAGMTSRLRHHVLDQQCKQYLAEPEIEVPTVAQPQTKIQTEPSSASRSRKRKYEADQHAGDGGSLNNTTTDDGAPPNESPDDRKRRLNREASARSRDKKKSMQDAALANRSSVQAETAYLETHIAACRANIALLLAKLNQAAQATVPPKCS